MTARITAAAAPQSALLDVNGSDDIKYGVREGANGPELVKRDLTGDTVLAQGMGTASAPGEWMLRLVMEDGVIRGKAWPAVMHEPSDYQVSYSFTGGASAPNITTITLDADAATTAHYVLAGPSTGTTIASNTFHSYVSCTATMPTVPPPADGQVDAKGDLSNQAEVKSFMTWAMDHTASRLVVLSAGTGNTVDDAGAVTACAPGMCLNRKFEAFELAYAALRAAGYSDSDLADSSRVRFVMWGFGNTALGQDLIFHTNGGGSASFVVRNLGGENSAMYGPDGAPATDPIPYIGTFAYTRQHMQQDAAAFRDAVNAYASTEPTFAAHSLVVSHSWGAAYTSAMVLEDDLGFHVDLAMTVALPKIAADITQPASCAEKLFISGCPGITADLDLNQGFYLAPGGLPLYRVDRPDDPVANSKDIQSLITTLKDVIGDGVFGGHDYVIRKQPQPATTQCTRSYQDCLVVVCCARPKPRTWITSRIRHRLPTSGCTEWIRLTSRAPPMAASSNTDAPT